MQGTARAPGTCGELLQGKINGIDFLITCPVDLYSEVTVRLNMQGVVKVDERLPKVRTAVERTLHFLGRAEMGADVTVSSTVPCGKGMASSTADIAASCAATAAALETYITPREIAGIALNIEPTDGIMFPGITLFDHVEGKILKSLGNAPEVEIVIVDLGGTVDTVSFNQNSELEILNKAKEHQVAEALTKIEGALSAGELGTLGQAVTAGAFAHQQILYKPELQTLADICRHCGGLGINIAHSGTVVGLLFEKDRNAGEVQARLAQAGFNSSFTARIIDGGVEVLQERAGERNWLTLNTYMVEICGKLQRSTG
jgi:L-threonine kinase